MSLGSGNLAVYNPQEFATINTTAGSGLTGGGTQSADRRYDVVGISGITVNNDNISVKFAGTIVSGCAVKWNGTAFVTD